MNNATTTKGTFVHPQLPKMGTMTGHVVTERGELVFMPDEKYHDKLFNLYDVEALEGLYVNQGTFTPAQ
jgi:hypothetical protein